MKVLFFDTETTGIPKHPRAKKEIQPRVIEFAALIVDTKLNEELTLELIINPERELEEIITKITGLTDDDLKDAPVFADVAEDIKAFIEAADVVIAHNAPFDTTMMNLEFDALGMICKWPLVICTVQENAERYGYRPKLTQLYEDIVGKPLDQKHRALDDVRVLHEICERMGVLDEISSVKS